MSPSYRQLASFQYPIVPNLAIAFRPPGWVHSPWHKHEVECLQKGKTIISFLPTVQTSYRVQGRGLTKDSLFSWHSKYAILGIWPQVQRHLLLRDELRVFLLCIFPFLVCARASVMMNINCAYYNTELQNGSLHDMFPPNQLHTTSPPHRLQHNNVL